MQKLGVKPCFITLMATSSRVLLSARWNCSASLFPVLLKPPGAVDDAAGQDLLLGRATFALEITAREPSRRGRLRAIIDGERKEIDAGLGLLFAGLILGILSLVIIVESWRMPRDLQGWPWYAGPGIVTGLLALGLLSMAIALLVRACRRPGAS